MDQSLMEKVDQMMQRSYAAFGSYRHATAAQRNQLLLTIAKEMENRADTLLSIAQKETHLDPARLLVELKRTVFQLKSYGAACENGAWMDIRIDPSDPLRNLPAPDLRKMMVPLGPVAVFGASNFPFAYSTAGGDTASALAAGCTVVVKGHPAHAGTSATVADAITAALQYCNLPPDSFLHLADTSFDAGKALVQHPLISAVGFTGSFEGGKALYDYAQQRKVPIPVFAEMGSVNPVFLFPEKLKQDAASLADMFAQSITLSGGQFCTNPGVIVGIDSRELDNFVHLLGKKISGTRPVNMLHKGIAKNYQSRRAAALLQEHVGVAAETAYEWTDTQTIPTIAQVAAQHFIHNELLHEEVFGPYSLVIRCRSVDEMIEVARSFGGQLTATLVANENEVLRYKTLIHQLQSLAGRIVMNGVPTGVEVALSMHHGGPFPATTDSRFTSVGADAMKRFARPVCFQNWPNALLPDELKDENPLQLWRTVKDKITKGAIK